MGNSTLTIESRSRPRYHLNLELQFSYRLGNRTYHGTGRTRDLSGKAISFESDQELPRGVQLELCIAWPFALQGLLPLDMIIHGALVKKQRSLAVLRLDEFEFRPRGEASFHAQAKPGDICSFLA
jgi:hypothetical protein